MIIVVVWDMEIGTLTSNPEYDYFALFTNVRKLLSWLKQHLWWRTNNDSYIPLWIMFCCEIVRDALILPLGTS